MLFYEGLTYTNEVAMVPGSCLLPCIRSHDQPWEQGCGVLIFVGLWLQPFLISRIQLQVKVWHWLLNLCECDSVLSERCRQTNSQDSNNMGLLLKQVKTGTAYAESFLAGLRLRPWARIQTPWTSTLHPCFIERFTLYRCCLRSSLCNVRLYIHVCAMCEITLLLQWITIGNDILALGLSTSLWPSTVQEEDFAWSTTTFAWELIPFFRGLSWLGLNPIKPT